jgi:protein-L-isoaspartate(D-aspartate) O-methyltransferase
MVNGQLRARGISDERVISAMRKVPRHEFVPSDYQKQAYSDHPLPIGFGQTISQPFMVAMMTEYLQLTGKEKVLEVGTGSGYQAAILGELAAFVYTVERNEILAKRAEKKLAELGYDNIKVIVGDGSQGLKEFSPYDRIVVTAFSSFVPQTLKEQLSEGGRLLIPIGDPRYQTLILVERRGEEFIQKSITGCVFVPLIGEYGWRSQDNNKQL